VNVMVVHHVWSSTCRMIGAWLANRKVPLLLALLVYFIHPSSSFWSENTVPVSNREPTHTVNKNSLYYTGLFLFIMWLLTAEQTTLLLHDNWWCPKFCSAQSCSVLQLKLYSVLYCWQLLKCVPCGNWRSLLKLNKI